MMRRNSDKFRLTLTNKCHRDVNLWIPMFDCRVRRIPVSIDRSTLQVRAGENDESHDGTDGCRCDYEPLEPGMDSKKPDEQNGYRDASEDRNQKPRSVCKPHPFENIDHFCWGQVGIVLPETVIVANSNKGLGDNMTSLGRQTSKSAMYVKSPGHPMYTTARDRHQAILTRATYINQSSRE